MSENKYISAWGMENHGPEFAGLVAVVRDYGGVLEYQDVNGNWTVPNAPLDLTMGRQRYRLMPHKTIKFPGVTLAPCSMSRDDLLLAAAKGAHIRMKNTQFASFVELSLDGSPDSYHVTYPNPVPQVHTVDKVLWAKKFPLCPLGFLFGLGPFGEAGAKKYRVNLTMTEILDEVPERN